MAVVSCHLFPFGFGCVSLATIFSHSFGVALLMLHFIHLAISSG